jgi:hypothetical protein
MNTGGRMAALPGVGEFLILITVIPWPKEKLADPKGLKPPLGGYEKKRDHQPTKPTCAIVKQLCQKRSAL